MPGLPQYAPIRSARSNREASGRGAARRGGAGPRASRSQGRALPLRYEPQLRGHLTDHQGVWHQAGGPCSLRPKRAALRRLLPLGILDPHEVTRRSLLLRPATCSGQDSQRGATSDRESPGRDPSWLSEAWGGLSGGCCLAQSGVARRLTDADVGYLAPSATQTVCDWAAEWMGFSAFTLKPKTVASYESLFKTRILPTFGADAVADIDGLMIRRWVAAMSGEGLSASRIKQAHSLLGQLFRSAVECGLLDHNPCDG